MGNSASLDIACNSRNLRAVTSTRPSRLPTAWLYARVAASRPAPSFGKMFAQRPQPSVQVAAQFADDGGFARERLLPPAVEDRPQQRDERRRRGEDDLAFHAVLDQRRIVLQRGGKEVFPRQKQHHELRRGRELVPVRLARERLDVRADVPGVAAQVRRRVRPRSGRRGRRRNTRPPGPWHPRRRSCRRAGARAGRAAAARRRRWPRPFVARRSRSG